MTAPWTVRSRCRPLRRRRVPGGPIRASRRSGGDAGSLGGAPSGALLRRTRVGGRPPVRSGGGRHGPDRLHRFQKFRWGTAPAAISSHRPLRYAGKRDVCPQKPWQGGGRGRRKERPRPGGRQRSQYKYYTTIFAARTSIFNQVCGLRTGEPSGAPLAPRQRRRDFRPRPLRIDAGAVTGQLVQCVCRCHRTSSCTRSGKALR